MQHDVGQPSLIFMTIQSKQKIAITLFLQKMESTNIQTNYRRSLTEHYKSTKYMAL